MMMTFKKYKEQSIDNKSDSKVIWGNIIVDGNGDIDSSNDDVNHKLNFKNYRMLLFDMRQK